MMKRGNRCPEAVCHKQSSQSKSSAGLALIELLVVIAIIGILVALLVPAVQQARGAARRSQCLNQLRQIGLAVHSFHDTYGAFPPARLVVSEIRTPDEKAMMVGMDEPSWLVRILPYLEQSNLYQLWDEYLPYGLQRAEVRKRAVPLFLCPERNAGTNALQSDETVNITFSCGCSGGTQVIPGGPISDYVANHGDPSPGISGSMNDFYWGGRGTGPIISSEPKYNASGKLMSGWRDQIAMRNVYDGLSQTILIGEPHIPPGEQVRAPYNGAAFYGRHLSHFARIGGPGVPLAHSPNDHRGSVYSFGSAHPGIVQFAMADGSARPVSTAVSTTVLSRLTNRSDGFPTGEF